MRLTLQQIDKLVDLIPKAFTLADYRMFLDDELGITLDNIAPDGTYEKRILKSIEFLNSEPGGRGDELLHALKVKTTNVAAQKLLSQIARHDYVSPTRDADDAIMMGKLAFVNRSGLRKLLIDFYSPDDFTSHVLQIRGESVSGKSHSWNLIRHIALKRSNAKPVRIKLDRLDSGDPVSLMSHIRLNLNLSEEGWPLLPDDPQDTQAAKQLASWFHGKMATIEEPIWLVIDDLNGPKPTPETKELIEHLAVLVDTHKPDNLWLVLVGFERQITDDVGRHMLEDEAFAPEHADVKAFFKMLGKSYDQELEEAALDALADKALKSIGPPLDHKKLQTLSHNIERMTQKIQSAGGFP